MASRNARRSWLSSGSRSSVASSDGSDDGASSSWSTGSDSVALRSRLSSRMPEYALRARRRRDWTPPQWSDPLPTSHRALLAIYIVAYVALWIFLFRTNPTPTRNHLPVPVRDTPVCDATESFKRFESTQHINRHPHDRSTSCDPEDHMLNRIIQEDFGANPHLIARAQLSSDSHPGVCPSSALRSRHPMNRLDFTKA